MKGKEEIKGQEGKKTSHFLWKEECERGKAKRGGVLRKGLRMKERRQAGKKDGHMLSERGQENKERKEWRERELVDVEVRK